MIAGKAEVPDFKDAPDTILLAGSVHTVQDGLPSNEPHYTAIGITGRHISRVGVREDIADWRGPQSNIIDYGGATITPGLVDAHVHPILGQSMARGLYLGDARSLAEVAEILSNAATSSHPDSWLLAWGLKQSVFGANTPNNDFIAAALPGNLVFIHMFDGHAGLASPAALTLAGVEEASAFSDNSEVVTRDDGKPTGFLRELAAMNLVLRFVPPLTFEEKVDGVYQLLRDMAAVGLTGIEMMDFGDPDSLEIFSAIEERWTLPVRVRIAPWILAMDPPGTAERVIAMQGAAGDRWEVRGVKLMLDGTVDNGTAWLYQPDTRGDSIEALWTDTDAYSDLLRRLHEAGITTTTHAIGDHAVGYVATAIAALPKSETVHRIEHIEVANDADLQMLSSSGATASMQPTHCTHFVQPDGLDAWSSRLGDERRSLGFRLRTLLDAGVTLALGSDWPVAPFDPRLTIADAQTRRRTDDPESQAIDEVHRLSAEEALRGYTRNVALSTGTDGGTVRIGAMADLTVWSSDPLATSPEDLITLPIIATYVNGKVSHTGDSSEMTG